MPTKLSSLVSPASQTVSKDNSMTSFSQPRAAYAIFSYNTSSTASEGYFLDSEFQRIVPGGLQSQYGYTGARYSYDGTTTTQASMFHGVSAGQSNQSSSSGYYPSGNFHGEYGSVQTMASSRGDLLPRGAFIPTTGTSTFGRELAVWCNSDHSDKSRVLTFGNGIVRMTYRNRPTSGFWAEDPSGPKRQFQPSGFPSGNQLSTMYGSASYNAVRKELVVMAYNSNSTGRFDIGIWKNVDLDTNPNNISNLSSAPNHVFNVITPNWSVTDSESQYNIKVVLTDDGSIFYSVKYESNSIRLYKVTRAGDDNSGSVALQDTQSTTTSYGRSQGAGYGLKSMQTRNGRMVLVHGPYYYYGCGISFHIIDKRNNTWYGNTYGDTAYGMQPVKYRDDSFAFYYAGNYYADNYSGAYINYIASPSPTTSGSPSWVGISLFPGGAPQPNTTNYPGLVHVWDYDLTTMPPAYSIDAGNRR